MKKILLGVSGAGTLFSGFLSATKLFSGKCAFNESCPIFLGLPACYFGFAMFLALFIIAISQIKKKELDQILINRSVAVSALGVLFSGSLTIREISQGAMGTFFGLSTCSYGFIFFVLMLALSVKLKKS